MNEKQFYKQLEKKVPQWLSNGWVNHHNAQKILANAQAEMSESPKFSFVLATLGVILLGAGMISFFAANWQGMSKLAKLVVMFSCLWLSYLGAALSSRQNSYPAMFHSLILLGVIVFGANIMLIAQIYHIETHYPNGVFLWAAGGFMTALLMRSELVLVLALGLTLLWSSIEIIEFDKIHWHFIGVWLAMSVFVIRNQFIVATHVALLSLFGWAIFSYFSFSKYASHGFIIQIYLLSGVALYMLAKLFKTYQCFLYFSEHLSRYALIFALIFMYILSFPGMELYPKLSHTMLDHLTWFGINIGLMVLTIVFLVLRIVRNRNPLALYQKLGFLWLAALFITLIWNVYAYQDEHGVTVIIVNLLLLSLVVWLTYAGQYERKHFYINAAFIIFAITLLSRYFDTFWTLLDHSLFFIVGGLLLLSGGFLLEKKRRQLSKKLVGR